MKFKMQSPARRQISIPSHSVEHTHGFNGRCSEQHDVKIAKLEDLVREHDGEKFRMERKDKIDEKLLGVEKIRNKLKNSEVAAHASRRCGENFGS